MKYSHRITNYKNLDQNKFSNNTGKIPLTKQQKRLIDENEKLSALQSKPQPKNTIPPL